MSSLIQLKLEVHNYCSYSLFIKQDKVFAAKWRREFWENDKRVGF